MGFDCMERIVGLPDRKILKYHNITPPEFLPNEYLKRYSIKGRDQLAEYRGHVEVGFGDSDYNRAELEELGYRYTGVLPIFFRPGALLEEEPSETVARKLRNQFNLLFVGRIAPNKCQVDLVRIFDEYYRSGNSDARLHLIGAYEGFAEYHEALLTEIRQRKLGDVVSVPGKVSAADLAAYYRNCQALVCASEHEGFCVPLLEAMAFDLPVVAYTQAAVPETLGGAGALLDRKDPQLWRQVLEELRDNPEFRERLLASQRQRLSELNVSQSAIKLLEVIRGLEETDVIDCSEPTLQIQGPFETSYSLAVVNRNLALALDHTSPFDTSIYCTEGPGDYPPKPADLVDKPAANWLWQKSNLLTSKPDITIRNLYPPRVKDVNGRINFLHFFWEDSLVPPEWVDDFNRHLDGILAPSSHVQQVLQKSGVNVPVHVIGTAVDERFFAAPTRTGRDQVRRPFTFLNISSGFPRKGIDVLLAAYFQEFTAADDVRLVLKTFPNPHNTVAEQLAAWRKRVRNPPECVHVDRDLTAEEIEQLYAGADCLAYPTRAEGFGLPVAEAMAHHIPVIVTGYSGHMDFSSQETAFLVGYNLVASQSHFGVPGAEWAEPSEDDLRKHMCFVRDRFESAEVQQRIEAAYAHVSSNLRWPKIAERPHWQLPISNRNRPSVWQW